MCNGPQEIDDDGNRDDVTMTADTVHTAVTAVGSAAVNNISCDVSVDADDGRCQP